MSAAALSAAQMDDGPCALRTRRRRHSMPTRSQWRLRGGVDGGDGGDDVVRLPSPCVTKSSLRQRRPGMGATKGVLQDRDMNVERGREMQTKRADRQRTHGRTSGAHDSHGDEDADATLVDDEDEPATTEKDDHHRGVSPRRQDLDALDDADSLHRYGSEDWSDDEDGNRPPLRSLSDLLAHTTPSRRALRDTWLLRVSTSHAQRLYAEHVHDPGSFEESSFNASRCIPSRSHNNKDKYSKINTRKSRSEKDGGGKLAHSIYSHHLGLLVVSRGEELAKVIYSRRDPAATTYQVSHLCHRTECCNPRHLVVEPEHINKERNACRGSIRMTFRGETIADQCQKSGHADREPCIVETTRLEDVLRKYRDVMKCGKCGEAWCGEGEGEGDAGDEEEEEGREEGQQIATERGGAETADDNVNSCRDADNDAAQREPRPNTADAAARREPRPTASNGTPRATHQRRRSMQKRRSPINLRSRDCNNDTNTREGGIDRQPSEDGASCRQGTSDAETADQQQQTVADQPDAEDVDAMATPSPSPSLTSQQRHQAESTDALRQHNDDGSDGGAAGGGRGDGRMDHCDGNRGDSHGNDNGNDNDNDNDGQGQGNDENDVEISEGVSCGTANHAGAGIDADVSMDGTTLIDLTIDDDDDGRDEGGERTGRGSNGGDAEVDQQMDRAGADPTPNVQTRCSNHDADIDNAHDQDVTTSSSNDAEGQDVASASTSQPQREERGAMPNGRSASAPPAASSSTMASAGQAASASSPGGPSAMTTTATNANQSTTTPTKRGPGRPRKTHSGVQSRKEKSPFDRVRVLRTRTRAGVRTRTRRSDGDLTSTIRRNSANGQAAATPVGAAAVSSAANMPQKRGPGRPRKYSYPIVTITPPRKRGPGRPKKDGGGSGSGSGGVDIMANTPRRPSGQVTPAKRARNRNVPTPSSSSSGSSPMKRPRGRPRKHSLPNDTHAAAPATPITAKRSPGRPRKHPRTV